MQYLVAYDIPEDARRNRVAKCLLNFGQRIQFSIFLCDLEATDYLRMARKVEAILDTKEDKLHIFSLCKSCAERTIVHGPHPTDDKMSIWLL